MEGVMGAPLLWGSHFGEPFLGFPFALEHPSPLGFLIWGSLLL